MEQRRVSYIPSAFASPTLASHRTNKADFAASHFVCLLHGGVKRCRHRSPPSCLFAVRDTLKRAQPSPHCKSMCRCLDFRTLVRVLAHRAPSSAQRRHGYPLAFRSSWPSPRRRTLPNATLFMYDDAMRRVRRVEHDHPSYWYRAS